MELWSVPLWSLLQLQIHREKPEDRLSPCSPSVFQPCTHTSGSAVPPCTDVPMWQDRAQCSTPSGWWCPSLPHHSRSQSKDEMYKMVGLVRIELGRAQLLEQLAEFKAIIPVISAKCHSEFPSVAVCPVQVSPCNGTIPYYTNALSWVSAVASTSLSTFITYSKGF